MPNFIEIELEHFDILRAVMQSQTKNSIISSLSGIYNSIDQD